MSVATKRGGILTAEERESFDRDGFLIVDDPCPPELVDAVLADIEPHYHDEFHPGPEVARGGAVYTRHAGRTERYYWNRVRNGWWVEPSVRAMALAPRVLAIIEELYGRPPLPFQTLNFPIGTEQSEHIDAFIFNSDPPRYMCGVWVALEDMDMDNGPLIYYPGSHKLDVPEWKDIEETVGQRRHERDYDNKAEFIAARDRDFMTYCQQLPERQGFKRHYATIRKGQALIWAANLVHGGAPHNDVNRTRHSQVTHYFFEGCRVYFPLMMGEDGHIFWQYPEWVHDPPPQGTTEELAEVIVQNVPEGATVVIAGDAATGVDLKGRETVPLPQPEVAELERLREAGAKYIVLPRDQLPAMEFLPTFQEHLEARYRTVFRDGGYCAIYALD